MHSDSVRKDVIVTRQNGDLEVYWNSYGTITFQRGFKANGKVAAIGNFTSGDNLEDVAVITDDTVKIYKNLGNGYLDSIPVYRLANVHASAVVLAQISSFIEPYATVYNTTSDKDEIILRQGDSIRIYLNNNSNGTSLSTILYTGAAYSIHKDFKISDLNHDGYNDIVIVEEDYGINVYRNSNGAISTIPVYRNVNESFFHTFTVAVGDFDKNGWNDIIGNLDDRMNLYLNNKSDSLFSQNSSETYYYDFPVRTSCNPLKSIVADVYNKGGLAVLFSNFGNVQDLTENDPLNEIEQIARINASDTDAVPAPAYLFGSNVHVVDSLYHPKLILFNRGDRDFLRYRIYKFNYSFYNYFLFDSTSSDRYIDTTEDMIYTTEDPVEPPEPNLFIML
ncbi:MAG: VCBS repeat-containing protein [Ignavibacteria bacterium]|nr:VCBS repeat-containing protein [Ignavibacteria bacterium]